MSVEYDEFHAKYYDLIHQKIPGEAQTRREILLIEKILRQYNVLPSYGRLLDVACGTGRHLLPLLERGYVVSGVDLSPFMVERLREKVRERGLAVPELFCGDIRSLELPSDHFGGAYCFFNSFGEIAKSIEEANAFLEKIRSFLLPEGWLLIEMYNLSRDFSTRTIRQSGTSGDVEVIGYPEIERYENLRGLIYLSEVIKVYEKGDFVTEKRLRYSVKLWSADELCLLLNNCGFRDVRVVGDDHELGVESLSSSGFYVLARK